VADLTDSQRKRAEARQRRRSQADAEPDEPEDSAAASGTEPRNSVKQAAKVAAAVGAAGAAAAAAKALTSHHEDGDEQPDGSESEEPEAESSEPEQQQTPEEPEQQQQQQQEHEPSSEQPDEQPVAGADPSDARRVIDRAREQLGDLLERPVESVSSLERTHDGWVAQLEVVELRRIPESTDVLGSYEMELDDDLNLRRYQQVRRYSRSQARGDGA
jgi:hypothetical protein